MVNLFSSQEYLIRENNSKRMQGENNPSYGLYGSKHPTSKFNKRGENNPNYGKKASEKCKQKTRESNTGMVTTFDTRDNTYKRVKKEEYHKYDYYTGSNSIESQNFKKMVKEQNEKNK